MSSHIPSPALALPDEFNVATYFVDRHVHEGRGAKAAFECGDEQVTYAQFAERVNRCGNALRRTLGVRREERVLLLLLDTPEFTYSFFGTIKIGAVVVPVNTLLRPREYEYLLNDCRARVAIVSDGLLPGLQAIPRERLPHLEHVVVVGAAPPGTHSFQDLLQRQPAELEEAGTSKNDAAFWLYSSGSTGFPKGCVHLHHDMVVTSELYAKAVLNIGERDRFFSVAKLFFAYGLGNALYFPLAVGGTAILWPGPPRPADVYAVIERHRPTLFFSVPSNYAALLAHQRQEGGDFDLSSVRYAVSAGEALPAALYERFKQRFGVEILDAIGSTEALHMFIANRPGAVRPGSSGQVIPGCEAKITDENGNAVPAGEIGNLWVRSDAICAGYWKQPEKTRETFQGEWLRTGDKYRQDEDGYFWYAGRSDDMLKVSGVWVSPTEIENTLVDHPAVLEAAVVGRPDQDELVKPEAWVVLRPGYAPTAERARELQEFVAARLAAYKRPRWLEFVPELPKTATGKIQRFKLRQGRGSASAG
jgi:benzoate-CoA ligase family protein